MSHVAQMDFVARVCDMYPNYFHETKVIEIGSLNINGTVRDVFKKPNQYIGVDLGEGPGVDWVCKGHEVPFADNFFDVAISCECFEHDKDWQKTFQKMHSLVHNMGLIVFSCATEGRAEHGTVNANPNDAPFTNDYYQNLNKEDFINHFDMNKMFHEFQFTKNPFVHDLYFWGIVCKD